jgi:tRNA 2-thiouridine synthesizing protein A
MTQLPEPDVTVDLTGESCPYTIVKSKLALEQIAPGQVMSVTVGDAESAQALPLNLAYDGHEVLAVNASPPGRSEVVVRKRGA